MMKALALIISAGCLIGVSALPTSTSLTKRGTSNCNLDNHDSITIVTHSDQQVRWDVFTQSQGSIQKGDVVWFKNNQPNGNEQFRGRRGPGTTWQFIQRGGTNAYVAIQDGGGTGLTTSSTHGTLFAVLCDSCNDLAEGNDLAASGCTFQQIFDDGVTASQVCMTADKEGVIATVENCNGAANQDFDIFSGSPG